MDSEEALRPFFQKKILKRKKKEIIMLLAAKLHIQFVVVSSIFNWIL